MCDYARVGFENMAVEERLTPHLNWLHVENLCHPALEKETHRERERERENKGEGNEKRWRVLSTTDHQAGEWSDIARGTR